MNAPSINDNERKVLTVLSDYEMEGQCLYFRSIALEVNMDWRKVRRVVRALARKGLAEYHRGLFDDDGRVAGSGYCISKAGRTAIRVGVNRKDGER